MIDIDKHICFLHKVKTGEYGQFSIGEFIDLNIKALEQQQDRILILESGEREHKNIIRLLKLKQNKLGKCKDGTPCGLGGFCKDCHSLPKPPEVKS